MARRPATHAITAAQARDHFDDIIRRASADGEPIVVEDDGGPMVVILAMSQYEQLVKEARLARFERASWAAGLAAAERGLTEEELERDIEEIKHRRHEQAYG